MTVAWLSIAVVEPLGACGQLPSGVGNRIYCEADAREQAGVCRRNSQAPLGKINCVVCRQSRQGAGSGDARVPRSRPQWRIAVHGPEGPQIETMALGSVLRRLADEREWSQYHWLMSLR